MDASVGGEVEDGVGGWRMNEWINEWGAECNGQCTGGQIGRW